MSLASIRCIDLTRVLAAFALTGLVITSLSAQTGRFTHGEMDMKVPIETESGYLFVDGSYLQPPYSIDADFEKNLVRLNGKEYAADSFDLTGYENRGRGMRGGGGPRGMGLRGGGWDRGERFAEQPASNPLREMILEIGSLRIGAIVVLNSERPPVTFWQDEHGHALLESLIAAQSEPRAAVEIPADETSILERETWQQLVEQFEATPEFLERAIAQVEEVNAVQRAIEDQHAAKELGSRISYPLTMFALVLVVGAIGHLLINSQPMFASIDDPTELYRIKKATVTCLVMVGLMSAIDLIWTLIANQSGTMRELNPLGSKLIGDTGQLMAFKIVVTSMSIGLLFWFRELPFARRATWWCCLVLTLLTARWLTFHSLFA